MSETIDRRLIDKQARCMMCDSPESDQDESERHADKGVEFWVLWTYCASCDCWTEHRPDGMPDYL